MLQDDDDFREAAARHGLRLAPGLRLVAPHLPVAVPEWRVFSPELIAYPRLEGDPAADFTLLFATLGRDVPATLLRRYGGVGGRTRPEVPEHVAESWRAYPAVLAEFAHLSGQAGPLELALTLLAAGAGPAMAAPG